MPNLAADARRVEPLDRPPPGGGHPPTRCERWVVSGDNAIHRARTAPVVLFACCGEASPRFWHFPGRAAQHALRIRIGAACSFAVLAVSRLGAYSQRGTDLRPRWPDADSRLKQLVLLPQLGQTPVLPEDD